MSLSPRLRLGVVPSWATLAAILMLAAALRFVDITTVGVRFDDESWYVSDARLWHRCALLMTDADAIRAAVNNDKQVFQRRMAVLGVNLEDRYGKPCQGYTMLGGLTMFIVGDRSAALLVTNAVFGTLSVLVLYLFGELLFNRAVGLAAALLLAVSPYHLVYCRSAFAEPTTIFFILLGAWFWASALFRRRPWPGAYFRAGLCLGCALTCHYRSGYVPVLLIAADLLLSRFASAVPEGKATPWPRAARRLLWLCGGIAAPILLLESVFQTVRLASILSDSYLPLNTFVEKVWKYWAKLDGKIAVSDGPPWNFQALLAYGEYFLHWHGAAAAAITGIGVVIVAMAKGVAKWPAIFVLATLGILLFQRYAVARAFSIAVPFACLCAAVGACRLWTMLAGLAGTRMVAGARIDSRTSPALTLGLAIIVGAPALANSWDLCAKRSDIDAACAYVASHGGGRVAVPLDARKYSLILDSPASIVAIQRKWPTTDADAVVAALRRDGVRWVITDPQHWHCRAPMKPVNIIYERGRILDEYLAANTALAAEFPHISDYRWEFLSEASAVAHLEEMTRERGGPLRIYDLKPLHLRSPPGDAVEAAGPAGPESTAASSEKPTWPS